MKLAIALACLVLASKASAKITGQGEDKENFYRIAEELRNHKAIGDTVKIKCAALQRAVSGNKRVYVTTTDGLALGPYRFAQSCQGYGPVWLRTLDEDNCYVGYACTNSETIEN